MNSGETYQFRQVLSSAYFDGITAEMAEPLRIRFHGG
jgi:hypothetical protein